MRPRAPLAALAALTLLFAASPMPAQELATGTWTGTIAPPGETALDVQYEVSYDEEGALAITLLPPAGVGAPPSIPFSDVALEDEALTFAWSAGSTALDCELLLLEAGSFEGECVDEDGVPGYLTMVPPADGGSWSSRRENTGSRSPQTMAASRSATVTAMPAVAAPGAPTPSDPSVV